MRKYFGTDGIRRIANTELTPDLVYKVAKAGAYVLSKHTKKAPTILIGRDTRISGTLIESAMTAGFLSYGAKVILLGVMPTPAVAYLTRKLNADASVVISASHNTYEFNGVKYFSNKGTKISDELELEIEEIIEGTGLKELTAINDKIGVSETRQDLIEEYVYFFRKTFDEDIEKYNRDDFVVGIDVANGATYEVADKVFNVLGIKHKIINSAPNGVNINDNCGSTHLENIKNYVIENRLSLGIAYDGDGDRCLAIDEFGNEIDGDVMLAIVSSYFKEKRILKNNALVATVMSNLGLSEYAVDTDITLKQTKVGDRYVLEEMQNGGYNLGGEQSGHIIFLDYNPTGDGILTSLMLIKILLEKNISASKAAEIMTIYPQTLVNAKVNSEKKELYKENEKIQKAIREAEEEFNGQGRVLIRPSGTEPLVRVMIEGKDKKQIEQKAKQITEIIEQELS